MEVHHTVKRVRLTKDSPSTRGWNDRVSPTGQDKGGGTTKQSDMNTICKNCDHYEFKPTTTRDLDKYKCEACGGELQELHYHHTDLLYDGDNTKSYTVNIMKAADGGFWVIDHVNNRCTPVYSEEIKVTVWKAAK